MAGTSTDRRSAPSRARRRLRLCVAAACALLAFAALSSSAFAAGPATDQYKLPQLSAGGHGGSGKIGGGGGDVGLPLLILGAAAVASGGAAFAYIRWRRRSDVPT
jgi:hypothetical protein